MIWLAVGGVVLLAVAVLAWRARPESPFLRALLDLGLSAGRGDSELPAHATGELDGVRVFAGMCAARPGKKGRPDQPPRVLLLVETGVLPGGRWGVDLSGDRPRPWGREGDGRQDVEVLLVEAVLSASRAAPSAALVPGDELGGLLDRAVRGRWPEGWQGLAARAFLPEDADAAALQRAFAALLELRSELRRAAERAELTEEQAIG